MGYLYTSKDGLLSSDDREAVARWDANVAQTAADGIDWTNRLRVAGVKFAAPDDGWVDRRPDGTGALTVSWYPLYDDHPDVGDLIALGCPPDPGGGYVRGYTWERDRKGRDRRVDTVPESAFSGYRLCRVTDVDRSMGLITGEPRVRITYADTGGRMPAPVADPGPVRRALRNAFGLLLTSVILTGLTVVALWWLT